jgi:hypothetical protein
MKMTLAKLFIFSALLVSSGLAWGAGPPVLVTHALAGSSKGQILTTLNFTMNVVNLGEAPLSALTLVLVPVLPLAPDRTTLEVAPLGPHEGVDLPLQVTMPGFLKAEELSRKPLSWTGTYLDAQGAQVDFHITSFPGGVR